MLLLKKVSKQFEQAGAVSERSNMFGFIDDKTMLTKSGGVAVALKFNGRDAECREPDVLDEEARQFESALRTFDESFVVQQYLIKKSEPCNPTRRYPDPVVTAVEADRWTFLGRTGNPLYEYECVVVITLNPATRSVSLMKQLLREPWAVAANGFSSKRQIRLLESEIRRLARELHRKVDSFKTQLQHLLDVHVLSKQEAFAFLRTLCNPSRLKAQAVRLKYDTFLDFSICDSEGVVNSDHLRVDDHFVKTLYLKDPPAKTFAHLLWEVYRVPCEFTLVSEWRPLPSVRARREIQNKRRHFFNTRTALWSHLGNEQRGPRNVLVDVSKDAFGDQLGALLTELEVGGKRLGEFSLSVVLYGKTLDEVGHAASEFLRIFGAHDASIVEERYNLLNSYFASMPCGHHFNFRRLLLLSSNYADLSFLFSPNQGERINSFLNAVYLIPLETEERSVFYYNLHWQDVAHTAIFGATGAGKTVLIATLILFVQKYQPITFIFDLGGGFEFSVRLFRGSHVKIGVGKLPFTINIFSLVPTKENLQFIASFVRVLIEARGYKMSDNDLQKLYEAVESVYELDRDQRRLLSLATMLPKHLRDHLAAWVEGGQYGEWFDNVEDTVTFSRFQSFDLEGMERYPELLEAVLYVLLHRINATVVEPELFSTLKVGVMDELWRFLKHPVIRAYVIEALKTWRKKNACMILATQSTEDLVESQMVRHVVESCPTKLFLANPYLDANTYANVFGLTETEIDRVKALIPKRQFLLKRPHLAKVLNLNLDPKSYWMTTTNPYESARRREMVDTLGLEKALGALANEE